jgi:preprotein translocase subunit YajC
MSQIKKPTDQFRIGQKVCVPGGRVGIVTDNSRWNLLTIQFDEGQNTMFDARIVTQHQEPKPNSEK